LVPPRKLRILCSAIVTKAAWCWHKNRPIDQWNRTEDPEIKPHSYNRMIFGKGAKNMSEKRPPLQQILQGKLDIHM
jgi:hypothetical protein